MSFETFAAFIQNHPFLSYPSLFGGAFIEILIPFAFVIPGELFFYTAGILGANGVINIWIASGVLILGGMLGDIANFFMGRYWGTPIERALTYFRFTGYVYERGKAFVAKNGKHSVLFARFFGPAGWVTPFLAGSAGMSPRRFLVLEPFPAVGAIAINIGIGYGAGLGYHFAETFAHEYAPLVGAALFILILGVPIISVLREPLRARRAMRADEHGA